MPGGALLEIVLIILFVCVTMSAIVSSAQELLFQGLGWRSRRLLRTVERMLDDSGYKKEISKRVLRHPLVGGAEGSRKHITHIEPHAFALALAHAVQPASSSAEPIEDLPNSVEALRDGELKQRLQMILPPASAMRSPEVIKAAVADWFTTSAAKTSERYKADARAASYCIAAVVTVAFNVSPIEIAQRLRADDSLRTTFASAVPDMAPMLYNPSEGLRFAPPAAEAVENAALQNIEAAVTPGAGTALDKARASEGLPTDDLKKMLSFYQCAESKLSLPVGWAWMADAAAALRAKGTAAGLNLSEARACETAIAEAENSGNDKLKASLASLNLSSATSFEREYGPSFETDHPLLIFAGWLIMVIAAGQGAPFWFNLLQRFVRR